jgi:AbrB family looped-hinge helix DNA binding protein
MVYLARIVQDKPGGAASGMRFIKKILERGTVTVPSDVREAIGVEEGDIVEFQIIRVVKRSGEPHADPSIGVPDAATSTDVRSRTFSEA